MQRGAACLFVLAVCAFAITFTSAQTTTVPITKVGSSVLQPSAPAADVSVQDQEFDPALIADDGDSNIFSGGAVINRSFVTGPGVPVSAQAGKKAKSNPSLLVDFEGINFRQQRLANGGNQFSIEPPDQGLCAGNGFVVEAVNDVVSVFNTTGTALMSSDLNTFYGYPAAINRTTGADGPEVTDPSCHFDVPTQRWFMVILTLDRVGTTSALAGPNHLDIAVSDTSSPLGSWTIYRIPVQNDGTQGTPDHGCVQTTANGLVHGPCLGDYPHIGADANGFYITTNEFSLFGPGFFGAQIYALSKQALVSGSPTSVTLFNTADFLLNGLPGHTVWPAVSPGFAFSSDANGTEYFASSVAVFSSTRSANQIRVWTVSNTASLNTNSPSLVLNSMMVDSEEYSVPGKANQKVGDFPLGQCLSDTVTNCWHFFLTAPASAQTEQRLDSNDSRAQQTWFANGKLWTALDTGLSVGGTAHSGIAYFILKPTATLAGVTAKMGLQGYVAGDTGTNLTYPAIGVTASGRGVIAFTLVGTNNFPSAAYAPLDALAGAGPYTIVADGANPEDGFAAYRPLSGTTRQRWGDYGAAATDGNTIWIASEYIGPKTGVLCNLSTFISTGFSCGGTRASFGNWWTHISQLQP